MPFDATDYVPATVDPRTLETPRERLIYLRDFLLGLPDEKFDMSWLFWDGKAIHYSQLGSERAQAFVESCGTVACIAGWTIALFDGRRTLRASDPGVAAKWLGLEDAEADDLFQPSGWDRGDPGYKVYSRAQAAAVLTHLIETGEVDWSVA